MPRTCPPSLLVVSVGLGLLAGASASASGCHGQRPPAQATAPADATATTAAPTTSTAPGGVTHDLGAGASASPSDGRRGVAHYAAIAATAVTSDGTAALSRDLAGGLRVWPSLDGSREPQPIAVAEVTTMSLERAPDGLVAALVDISRGGHLATLGHAGEVDLIALPASSPWLLLTVMPGGARVVGVGGDHGLVVLDRTGRELATLRPRGQRVVAVHPIGPDRAVVISRDDRDPAAPVVTARRLSVGATLAWQGAAVALPFPVVEPAAIAVSPRGARLAYLAQDPVGARLLIVDLAGGGEVPVPDGPAGLTQPASLGFADDDTLLMATQDGTTWRYNLTSAVGAYAIATAVRTSLPVFGGRVQVAGHQTWLAVQDGADAPRYLGYHELSPTAAAFAPDASAIAWTTGNGAIVVERLDGGADIRLRSAGDWYGGAAMIDDHTVLASRSSGAIGLVDVTTGAELASLSAWPATIVQYEPSTRLAVLGRYGHGAWVVAVAPGTAAPLSRPMVVSDRSAVASLLDPELAGGVVLSTIDTGAGIRDYRLADLERGVSAAEMKVSRAAGILAFAADRSGRRYAMNGEALQIWKDGKLERSIEVESSAHIVMPSPTGDRVAVALPSGAVVVYDRNGDRLWTVPTGPLGSLTWSRDGRLLAIPGSGGTLIVDTVTGQDVRRTCGLAFAVETIPPQVGPPGGVAICR